MKTYLIVLGLLRRDEEILLLQQQGPNKLDPIWSLPGGLVQDGEMLIEGLEREVRQKAGLEITEPGRLLYTLHKTAPDHQTLAFMFEVVSWQGELKIADGDGLIRAAQFVSEDDAIEKLQTLPWPHLRDPIVAYLNGKANPGAAWMWRQLGDEASSTLPPDSQLASPRRPSPE